MDKQRRRLDVIRRERKIIIFIALSCFALYFIFVHNLTLNWKHFFKSGPENVNIRIP